MVVMTIAGFDPSAGAGTLADVKTISAFGCYGVGVITSLTFQNTQGVFGAQHQSREVVARQLNALFEDFDIAAIKTGMLPTREIIAEIGAQIVSRNIPCVVIDPVVRSTSGFDLIDNEALAALIEMLFPLASVVTPNVIEAERITGIKITGTKTRQQAAEAMLGMRVKAVLITGGDLGGQDADDLLVDEQGAEVFTAKRVDSRNTHGTGCTLSSALASLLALGHTLREAIPIAKHYIAEAIQAAPDIGHGHGPLNHFPPEF